MVLMIGIMTKSTLEIKIRAIINWSYDLKVPLTAAYLLSECSEQHVVGGGRWRGLGPLFDHLSGHPDQTRHLQDGKNTD